MLKTQETSVFEETEMTFTCVIDRNTPRK